MDKKPSTFSVIDGGADSAPQRREPGHYFDQTFFELHYRLQSARAHRMALEEDLSKLGIVVDPVTGEVTLTGKSGK